MGTFSRVAMPMPGAGVRSRTGGLGTSVRYVGAGAGAADH